MMEFLSQNIATIVIGAVLLAIVVFVVISMVKSKKQGKSSCGCGCSSCPSASMCHSKGAKKK